MAKIYLAAMHAQMHEMRRVRDRFVLAGHEVTSQWIDGKEADDIKEAAAVMDIGDLKRADVLVHFSLPRGTMYFGGGRQVEYGAAMMLEKKIMVVGPQGEHVFHCWPGVMFFDSVDALLSSGEL